LARQAAAAHTPASARAIAWDILRKVEEHGAHADAALARQLNAARGLPVRDQALITRLVYGTLAWQGYLDHILNSFARRAPADIDSAVRVLLRLALFQTCLLTRIPAFAAVNTAVDLAKQYRHGAAATFVNAVLRRAASNWTHVEFPSRDDDPLGYLATRLSHPAWLVERWIDRYGFDETEALLHANNAPGPTVLRVNHRAIDRTTLMSQLVASGCAASATIYSPSGVRIEAAGAPELLPGYTAGHFSVQGEAAQLVSLLVAPAPDARVLDACAAPGGKTTHIAELMDDRGQIVALDPNRRSMLRLQQTTARLRLTSITPIVTRAEGWHDQSLFDCVLIDAPCSGFGTLRAHPEIKWRRTPLDIHAGAQLQTRLLDRLAGRVRPGGIVVYATCTLTHEENEDVLNGFLRTHPEFHIEDPRPLLPHAAQSLVGEDDVVRTWPHRHDMDGFFAARLHHVA